ncbi:MAG: glycosyltransferase family 4 protein [Hydrogenophaga sp.]|uniref:glycosyltransferase family 4 protein n=1 Tax=Hydrogenophaga sp. TaxID=1904254 RepID=UPI00257E0169|nr:glycosyltransferase family 4 protein [Hydrogenophaga sp.]MBL0946224.1 glycosyltransferase family 4 protein [Hydrogenophaga sp.]
MSARAPWVLLVPGDLHTPTGGYVYDRRLLQAWRAQGRAVDVLRLDGDWPHPDAVALARAAAALAALPDGACVVADGLAFGVLAAQVAPHAQRLRWVALVHHPLHLETGLAPALAEGLRRQEGEALRHAHQVVVTSAHTSHDVAALGVPAARIAVVEPGTDGVALPAPRPRAPDGPVELLCVATLTPRKDHGLLLRALGGLLHLDWRLHAVGSPTRDAAHARALHALTASGPLAPRVVWHGELAEAALQARYAAADAFVLASRHEGYGMVINEALQHGLPVVASRAGALAQTVPPEAGLLVPAGDESAWRAALAAVIGDAALRARLAAGARAAAQHLPAWPQQAARFAALIDAVEA